MNKNLWYGVKDNHVRFFETNPSSFQGVSAIGQCTLTSSNNSLDITGANGESLIVSSEAQQTSQPSAQAE